MKALLRRALWTTLAFLGAAAFLVLVVDFVAGQLLCSPATRQVGALPSDLVGRAVEFRGESLSSLRGWFLRGSKGTGAVILMHGVRADRTSMVERARFLTKAGYSVLLFDFQAHGESPGAHITFGFLESRDARAAVDFLHRTLPDERIGIIGVSMGGAATILAVPPLDVQAVVLESVYPTIDQAVSDRLVTRLGGWSGVLTPLLTSQLKYRLGFDATALRPIERVGSMHAPKLFLAGTEDRYTTLDESRALFDAAAWPKEFWPVPGAAHVDLYEYARDEYEKRVSAFLGEHLR